MQQNVNLEQAIQIITQVAAKYVGTLQEHQTIQNALKVLINAANEPKIEIKADKIEENTSN
jgi:hypothetical protein